jgi:small-conductance mechanosensitive channel
MGIFRSVFWGSVAWFSATALLVHPEMALGLAIVVAFLSESTHHGAELRRMHRDGRQLSNQLRAANRQVEELERALTRRHVELNNAIEELQRRDAVGSPAARELLKRQEEAMTAASNALEARHERNDVVFDSMERLLNMQVEQTANMQQAMSNFLQHLISQPRGHFTMRDSVLVNEGSGQDHALNDAFAEVNAWLSEEAAPSP